MHLGFHHRRIRRKPPQPPRILLKGIATAAVMDTLVYVISFASLLFTLDQVRLIWMTHATAGVSTVTWVFYTISSFAWLMYGYVHRDRVIMITSGATCVIDAFIVLGLILFR